MAGQSRRSIFADADASFAAGPKVRLRPGPHRAALPDAPHSPPVMWPDGVHGVPQTDDGEAPTLLIRRRKAFAIGCAFNTRFSPEELSGRSDWRKCSIRPLLHRSESHMFSERSKASSGRRWWLHHFGPGGRWLELVAPPHFEALG